jgi:uncharacterized phage infection (PIP) family protein YhgE
MADEQPTVEELQQKIDGMEKAFRERLNAQKEKYEAQLNEAQSTIQDLTGELEKRTSASEETGDELATLQKQMTTLQDELDAQKQAAAQAQRQALAAKIGTDAGLPSAFYGLIQGDDEEAMQAHAEELAAHVKPSSPGNLPRGNQETPTVTPEQLQDAAWVRENKGLVQQALDGS